MIQALTFPKIISALVAFALILFLSYPVLAENATSPATRREQAQERVGAKKEDIQKRIEAIKVKIATREAALKAKLQAFRDQKKAAVVERINESLNRINQKMMQQMLKHLDKMTSILDRLEARVNSGKPDIKNVDAAKVVIADAREAIASASAAVIAQAEEDYTVSITSESKIRTDVRKVRDRLHEDLKTVRALVIDAKQAVADAIRVAKSGPKVKEGTPSGTQ